MFLEPTEVRLGVTFKEKKKNYTIKYSVKFCIRLIRQRKSGSYGRLKKLLIPLELLRDLLSQVREG